MKRRLPMAAAGPSGLEQATRFGPGLTCEYEWRPRALRVVDLHIIASRLRKLAHRYCYPYHCRTSLDETDAFVPHSPQTDGATAAGPCRSRREHGQ